MFDKRNIVLNQSAMTGLGTFVVGLLVSFGVIPAESQDGMSGAASAGIASIFALMSAVHIVLGYRVHKKVTPVTDPRDNFGNPLTPAGS